MALYCCVVHYFLSFAIVPGSHADTRQREFGIFFWCRGTPAVSTGVSTHLFFTALVIAIRRRMQKESRLNDEIGKRAIGHGSVGSMLDDTSVETSGTGREMSWSLEMWTLTEKTGG